MTRTGEVHANAKAEYKTVVIKKHTEEILSAPQTQHSRAAHPRPDLMVLQQSLGHCTGVLCRQAAS